LLISGTEDSMNMPDSGWIAALDSDEGLPGELFTKGDKMCGLTERLLLRLLDIDYRQTPMGRERYY